MTIIIENFIPHRDRMKLIDAVIETGDNTAVSEATVTDRWPLVKSGSVHPMVIVELAAQTSGVAGGLENQKKNNTPAKGWIVGVKKASFYTKKIPVGSRIITRVRNRFAGFGNFLEVEGTSETDSKLIGELVLQVIDDDGSGNRQSHDE